MGNRFQLPPYLRDVPIEEALARLGRGPDAAPSASRAPETHGRHSHEFKAARDQARVDLALTLAAEAAKILRSREQGVREARARLDELMMEAVQAGATTTEVANTTRISRVTVSKAVNHRASGSASR